MRVEPYCRKAAFVVLCAGVVFHTWCLMAQQPSVATHSIGETAASADELLARPITIAISHVSLKRAIDSVMKVSHVVVQYQVSMLKAYSSPVTVQVVGVPVGIVLERILNGTTLRVVSDGQGALALVDMETSDSVPSVGVVAGRVVDSATGRGVRGATVKVAGTKLSAVTSDSGRFVLSSVPVGDQLMTVKLFGYRPAERAVTVTEGERTIVHLIIVPVTTVLSGVVTTATGIQRRIEVGNDITVLNADSIQQVAPVTNITQMLETRVPGLVVQHTSGIPGAPSRLRLRGLSSVNMSADPILIVDGVRVYADQSASTVSTSENGHASVGSSQTMIVGGGSGIGGVFGPRFAGPSALDQIDPSSIETIEVLKGPSATAIYGSDAANGVIVVTTKHGRVGPTHWTVNVDRGRTALPGNWPVNYFLFGHDSRWDFRDQSGLCAIFSGCLRDSVVAFQALDDPRYSPLTGQPGQNYDGSLTVSGGSGTLTYSVTGSSSTQSGYLHLPPIEVQRFQAFHSIPVPGWMRTPDQYTTYGENSTLSMGLGTSGGSLTLSDAVFHSAQQQSSLQTDLASLSTMYVDTSQLAETPLFPDYYTRAQLNTTTFTNAVSLNNWAPWHWLPLMATAGLNVQNQDNNTLLPRDYFLCNSPADCSNGNPSDTLGRYEIAQGTNTSGSLTIGTTVLQQRLVSTAIGLNVNTIAQSGYSAETQGLPIGVSVPNNFVYSDGTGPSYSTIHSATYGWYMQPTLNLNSRFFASPGFRLDGGSNSGAHGGVNGGALSLFPKLDFSWIAVQRSPSEPLFGSLTLLRPRIAVGIAGVEPGPAAQLRLLQPYQVLPLSTDASATPADILTVQSLGNTELHAERDREVEGGFDAQFWNQRLSLTLTGYRKMAYDAILAIPVAASVLPPGTQASIAKNIGTIRNTGVEATIAARLVDSRTVDWSINATVSKTHNLLVSLAPGQPPIQINGAGVETRVIPGYPLFSLWARPIVEFGDVNRDGVIDPNEVRLGDSAVYVGTQQPNYELSASADLGLFNGRVRINTSIDYQNGLTQTMSNANVDLLLNNPTMTAAEQAAFAVSKDRAGFLFMPTQIGLVQTVNLLRWNTLSLTYLAPSSVTRLVHVPTLSFALQGSNLALHSNYRGKDPNVNTFSSGNLTADDGNALPQPRVWNLRVTLGY